MKVATLSALFLIPFTFTFGEGMAHAETSAQAEAIYNALNVPVMPLPTAYPKAMWRKSVGGLVCDKTTYRIPPPPAVTVDGIYNCTLNNSLDSDPLAIFQALDVALLPPPPTVFGESLKIKSVGNLECQIEKRIHPLVPIGSIEQNINCDLK